MFYMLCIRKRKTVSYLHYVHDLECVHRKDGNCIISTVCLCSIFCVSERGKLYHTYSMFMIQILCIRKRETVSYLQYVYVLDFVHKKVSERGKLNHSYNMFIFQVCVSERVKLYHTYNMFMFYILCIRKRETVSYLQYVYVLDFVYKKVSERGKLHHAYTMLMFQIVCIRKRKNVSYLQCAQYLDYVCLKDEMCIIPT